VKQFIFLIAAAVAFSSNCASSQAAPIVPIKFEVDAPHLARASQFSRCSSWWTRGYNCLYCWQGYCYRYPWDEKSHGYRHRRYSANFPHVS
jgi:hypothetical protein